MQNVSCGVLYTALIGFNRFIGCRQRVFFIYLHWRGAFGVARFDKLGDARASTRGASDRRDSALFRMYSKHLLVKQHKMRQVVEKTNTCSKGLIL